MLTKKQIDEIKNHLDKAQNPVFFFDNDPDGLCSYLLLRRYCGKGKGVAIRSFPKLDKNYFRKVLELNADYIFVLDKPMVSEEFLQEVKKYNLPLVWIDHHELEEELGNLGEFIYYYNPVLNKEKSNEPATHLCYQISQKDEDLWLAIVGCIGDSYVPEYYDEFLKKYPDLAIKDNSDAFKIYYNSPIGTIVKIFTFALKDKTSNVVRMLKYLAEVKSPYEVLEENNHNHLMHQRFRQINERHKKLLDKAKGLAKSDEKVLFFQYGGDMSISSDLANKLSFIFSDKIIVVVYIAGAKANISVRGKNVKEKVLKAIEDLEFATGGGHDDAVGAKIRIEDLEIFRERMEEEN